MDIDVVDPALRASVQKIPKIDLRRRSVRVLVRWVGRHLLCAHTVPGVRTRDRRAEAVRVRTYVPAQPSTRAALLWIHGGGLVIGSARQDDRLCAETAARWGMTVVSAEYRHAPEAPFPAALDDVHSVWQWMTSADSGLDIDPERIVVGGESAGGGLAASLVHLLHDTSAVQPIAQWLFCPMLDDRTAADRTLDVHDHWVWNNELNRMGWSSYLPVAPGAITVPDYAVPARRQDLSGLPPTWICVGDIELFLDEDTAYAERLRAAGVEVELDVVAGAPHGFENWAAETPPARVLVARAEEWLSRTPGLREPA